MNDLYEALNRAHLLDESTEGGALMKLKDAAESVKCKLTPDFRGYALKNPEHVDAVIEDEILYCGNALCKEFPNMKFWSFGEDDELYDMHGDYCVVETGTEEGRILVQLDGDGRIYKLDESLRSQRGKTVNEAVKKDTKNTKIERPKGYKGTAGGYLSIDRYGTFVSRKPDSGGVQISSANYDWITDNFDLVEQHNLEYKTLWGRGVVYKIVEKK